MGKRLLIILGYYFSPVTKKLETLYGICYFEVLLYYYVHHHNTCNSPYLSLYLSTLWSYRNSKLKTMFTLKGCFDGDGGLVGSGGSVGSWPNARLRQMTRIRCLFMFNLKLRICFLQWKTQVCVRVFVHHFFMTIYQS